MEEVTTLAGGALAGVSEAAARAKTPLLWLLAPEAQPNERTLPELVAAAQDAAVSVALTRDGEPDEAWLGTFAEADVEALLAAARERWIPLRFTPAYSLLVTRDLVLAHEPPDPARYGPYADIEWTARLFAKRPGMLVTASAVTLPPRRLALAPRALARLGSGPGLRRTDPVRHLRLARASRRAGA